MVIQGVFSIALTVHWMKDNFVRFVFFKIKFRDVCYDKSKGFKKDFSKKITMGAELLRKLIFNVKQ